MHGHSQTKRHYLAVRVRLKKKDLFFISQKWLDWPPETTGLEPGKKLAGQAGCLDQPGSRASASKPGMEALRALRVLRALRALSAFKAFRVLPGKRA